MNFLAMLRLVFSLLPIIHEAIDQIETLFPQGGNGATKLAMVQSVIEKAMKVTDTGGAVFSAIWPTVAGLIGDIVAMKKKIAV
jgi:hypothetical protein